MGTVILDGRESAARIKKKLANYITSLQKEYKIIPGLAVIRVGNHQASQGMR